MNITSYIILAVVVALLGVAVWRTIVLRKSASCSDSSCGSCALKDACKKN